MKKDRMRMLAGSAATAFAADDVKKIVADLDTNTSSRSGDTAVVTALWWAKGTEDGKPLDYKLWFSDVYVRTPAGWRYVFGQASLPLPKAP